MDSTGLNMKLFLLFLVWSAISWFWGKMGGGLNIAWSAPHYQCTYKMYFCYSLDPFTCVSGSCTPGAVHIGLLISNTRLSIQHFVQAWQNIHVYWSFFLILPLHRYCTHFFLFWGCQLSWFFFPWPSFYRKIMTWLFKVRLLSLFFILSPFSPTNHAFHL